jgi:lipid-A-disaccharide synthase
MRRMVEREGLGTWVKVTDGGSHDLMQRACCGVIASGTATLEAAYFGLPYLLAYRVAWPTYLLGKMLVKIDFIGLVNILAKREVVRELIQSQARGSTVAAELTRFLDDPNQRAKLTETLQQTAALLGGLGAHQRAAGVVATWLRRD